jgi:hypothetical protein
LVQYITHLEAQERYQGSHAAAELEHDVERWLLQPFKLMIKEAKENLQQQQERVAASCARVSALMDNCEAMTLQAVSVLDNTIGGGLNAKIISRTVHQSAERRQKPEDVIREGEEILTGMKSMVEQVAQRVNYTLEEKQA